MRSHILLVLLPYIAIAEKMLDHLTQFCLRAHDLFKSLHYEEKIFTNDIIHHTLFNLLRYYFIGE